MPKQARPLSRPAIPKPIKDAVWRECENRCAVCGEKDGKEFVHIIPCVKVKQHTKENIILLCANHHRISHEKKWSEKQLRNYKNHPFVGPGPIPPDTNESTTNVVFIIAGDMRDFSKEKREQFRLAIADFVQIMFKYLKMVSIKASNSILVTIQLPEKSADILLKAYKRKDPKLSRLLASWSILEIIRESEKRNSMIGDHTLKNIDYENAFLKVFTTLDYLKLVDHSPKICLIGELFRFNISIQTKAFSQIDGHLGVTAKALAQLQDSSEHAYKLSIIAKIMPCNELDELKNPTQKHKGGGIGKIGLIDNGEIRPMLTERQGAQSWFPEGPISENRILRCNDLTLPLIDLIEKANCIGLMCTRVGNNIDFFQEFVDLIVKGEIKVRGNDQNICLFVNSNVHKPGEGYTFDPDLASRHLVLYTQLGRYIQENKGEFWLSVSNEELSALLHRRQPNKRILLNDAELKNALKKLANRIKAKIFYHDRKCIKLCYNDKIISLSTPIFTKNKDLSYNDIILHGSGDALNAGLILSIAARRCLSNFQNIDVSSDNIAFQSTSISLPEIPADINIDDSDCAAFAQMLAVTRLIKLQRGFSQGRLLPPPTRFEVFNYVSTPVSQKQLTFSAKQIKRDFQSSIINAVKYIYKIAFASNKESANLLFNLLSSNSCTPLLRIISILGMRHKFYYKKPLSSVSKWKKESNNFVLWDLDNTLINSKLDYNEIIWEGLQELPSVTCMLKDANISRQKGVRNKAIKLANSLYEKHDYFVRITNGQFPDFRRVWNSKEFFATFLTIWLNPPWCEAFIDDIRSKEIPALIPQQQLITDINAMLMLAANAITSAYERCNNAQISLFDHTIEVIKSLSIFGIKQYIVTEGDDTSQVLKWKNSELNELRLISEESVLSSYRAGEKGINLPALITIKSQLGDEQAKDALERIRAILENFKLKSMKDFYTIVLRTLATFPNKAKSFLALIGTCPIGRAKPLKCVMIGDTYKNDIRPIKELNAGVDTIMVSILKDRFCKQANAEMKKSSNALLPDCIAPTLCLIQDRLLSPAFWRKVKNVATDTLMIDAFRFDVPPDIARSFMLISHFNIFGIDKIINDILYERSLSPNNALLTALLAIIIDDMENLEIREYALNAITKIKIRDNQYSILHQRLNDLLRCLNANQNKPLLEKAIDMIGQIGRKSTLEWLSRIIAANIDIFRPSLNKLVVIYKDKT